MPLRTAHSLASRGWIVPPQAFRANANPTSVWTGLLPQVLSERLKSKLLARSHFLPKFAPDDVPRHLSEDPPL